VRFYIIGYSMQTREEGEFEILCDENQEAPNMKNSDS
jgi:hypothetical protein